MIFSADSRSEASRLVEDLKQQIQRFDLSENDARYLFASYVQEEEPPFSVEEYVLRRNS